MVDIVSVVNLQGAFGAHQPGDLFVCFAISDTSATPPSIPAAGSGVPEYQLIQKGGYTNGKHASILAVYGWATASDHVTGVFPGSARTVGYVLRGADPVNPIGGKAQNGTPGTMYPAAPNVTLEQPNGASALLYHIVQLAQSSSYQMNWQVLPNGFTQRYKQVGLTGIMSANKNAPVTSGSGLTAQTSYAGSVVYASSVEVVGPRPEPAAVKVLDAGVWKDGTPKGVLQGGVWKTPQKVSVLDGGSWKQAWP